MAEKQAVIGICFCGVQRFQRLGYDIPMDLYMKWLGMAAKIQQRNEVVNAQCVDVQKMMEKAGFRTYIMKGQGNSALYRVSYDDDNDNLCLLRQSGDIDIYLDGGFEKVNDFVQRTHPTNEINELEIHYHCLQDTEVEIHYRPFIMRNPFKNRKLQKFFDDQSEACFTNRISIENKAESLEIMAPTIVFNLVHQMVHTYHHFITEGVGLRQLMDYYFVIQASNADDVFECQKMVESLGLNRFASALMWVLMHVFGLKVEQALWAPCEKDGRLLLDEILMSGNFGHTDERAKDILTSRWKAFWFVNSKTFRFWRFDHWAWFWSPVWRAYHFLWRKMKGFK